MRRFGQAIGQREALPPAQTVGGVKPHKGRKPDCGFAEPWSARTGAERIQSCYAQLVLLLFFQLLFYFNSLLSLVLHHYSITLFTHII
jgi:hypothetical protein